MKRGDVIALAERVERAAGADRAALFALGVEALEACGRDKRDPNPALSLDAAAALVPAGWAVGAAWWHDSKASVTLWGTHEFRGGRWHGSKDPRVKATAATPAQALTAAALRAIAEEMPE
jgi:hypothetical protein